MNEIVKLVSTLPPEVDAKVEPLNSRLTALALAIESLSKLSENVEKIREEFTGFRGFRERIEGRERTIERSIKKFALWVIGGVLTAGTGLVATIAIAAYQVGSTMGTINTNVSEMKSSIDKLQASAYELNGTTKDQGARLNDQGELLKKMDERLEAVQVSVRQASAKTAAETSDKTAERIAGVLEAAEKRTGRADADVLGRLEAIERKVEEASDVLVLSLALTARDRPISRLDASLTYYLLVPPQQKQKAIRAIQSKTPLDGAVNFFDGDVLLRPTGVTATAQPMKVDGRVPIRLFFQDRSALEGFEKLLGQLSEAHKSMRLRVTFALE